jgi:hypothetical protein
MAIFPILLSPVICVSFAIVVYYEVITVQTASDYLLIAFFVNCIVEALIFFHLVSTR